MWESPIYKVIAKINDKDEDIFIDVTGSAPNFREPMKQLEGTFGVLLNDLEPKKTKILDFGAAKLRNTLYLLKKGFTVYSCEFKDLLDRSQQAKEFYEECEKYKNFKRLVFPDDFIDFDENFDVILLINVLNIMPVPIERLCVLALCRKKIKNGGRLLWYTQHGTYSEDDAVGTIYDGLITGKRRRYHMFYRDFSREEIHSMLESTGFSYNKNFKFSMSGTNQAYMFEATGEILIDKTLGLTSLLQKSRESNLKKIERDVRWEVDEKGRKSKKVTYETKIPKRKITLKGIDILEQYSEELKKLKPGGGKKASKYHQLIFNILVKLFDSGLKNPQKEEKINQGRKRIDITFDNRAEEGFFKELKDQHKIKSPIIIIECKNYTNALENEEYDQIEGRLNLRRGMFGIIICRNNKDEKSVFDHCRDLVRENPGAEKYVIVLDDLDIQNMIRHKLNKEESKIDDLLRNKFRKLIM